MEDKEVLKSKTEKHLDGNLKMKISEGLCKTNILISPSEGSTRVQAHVDVNLNNDRPTLPVYSPNEIPRKNQGSSFQMVKSKEAAESNPSVESEVRSNNVTFGALSEQSVQTEPISKGLHMSVKEPTTEDHDESFSRSYECHPLENVDSPTSNGITTEHETTNLCRSMHNPCSGLQINFPLQPDTGRKDSSCPIDISMCSPSSVSPLDFASQMVRSKGHKEDQGPSFPDTVSALSTSSTAIIADAALQQRSEMHSMMNSELSFKFGSSLQRLPLGQHY